jgi:hypothetical protein
VANGSYRYTVSVSGYTATPQSGSLNVTGKLVTENIAFKIIPEATQNLTGHSSPYNAGPLVLGLVALAVVLAIVAGIVEWRERRAMGEGERKAAASPPQEPPQTTEGPDAAPPAAPPPGPE